MTNGVCALCGQVVAKGRMTVHLRRCVAAREARACDDPTERIHHLVVTGRYEPEYWLHVEMPAKAALYWLDSFLRGIWLECCGHLSGFMAGRRELDDHGSIGEELAFVGDVDYTYDYGSSTNLKIRVAGEREGHPLVSPVALLARNQPPDVRCHCGEPAVKLCRECRWDGTGWLCKQHARRHRCGTEMLAPVNNSPRVGECGYWGTDADALIPGRPPAELPGLALTEGEQIVPERGRDDDLEIFRIGWDVGEDDEADLDEDDEDELDEAGPDPAAAAAVEAIMALVEPFCERHLSPLWSASCRRRLEQLGPQAGCLYTAAEPSLWACATLLGELRRVQEAHPGRAAEVGPEMVLRELSFDPVAGAGAISSLLKARALATLTSWEFVRAEPRLAEVLELALPACRELGLEAGIATLAANLIRALAQLDPDAVCRARATSWAAAGILAAVECNPEADPDLAASPVAVGRACSVSEKTLLEKHAQLAHFVGPFGPDADWRLLRFRDPAEVFAVQLGTQWVDARTMPREWQEEAKLLGLIPQLPEDWPPPP